MSARPPVCLLVSAWLPLVKFSWNLILGTSRKSVEKLHIWRSRVLFTRGSKYVCIVDSRTKYFVALQQCKGKQLLYFCVNTLYFWQLHVGQQQYKWNALLRFDGNNAPQCYIVRTLLTLYGTRKFITLFTGVRSLHLPRARVIQSTFSLPNSLRSI